jgi:flagellin-like hook-associated protein FlgL
LKLNSGKKMSKKLRRFIVAGATVTIALGYFSCGDSEEFNILQPVAEPIAMSGDRAAMEEEAKVLMDGGDYEEAVKILEKMIDKDGLDTNGVRLLYAAAQLGVAELDVWSIITKFLDSQGTASRSSGVNDFFDSFTETFLGSGEERDQKTEALESSINVLAEAPYPDESDVKTTACLLAGMLAVPTLADAQDSLDEVQAALTQIKDAAISGGTECPNIDLLTTATAALSEATTAFNLILSAADGCPFLDLSETQALMNTVQSQMAQLVSTADNGCRDLPTCPDNVPDCQSLFPSCVQDSLALGADNPAESGDGIVASCELILHCTDPLACFGGAS